MKGYDLDARADRLVEEHSDLEGSHDMIPVGRVCSNDAGRGETSGKVIQGGCLTLALMVKELHLGGLKTK